MSVASQCAKDATDVASQPKRQRAAYWISDFALDSAVKAQARIRGLTLAQAVTEALGAWGGAMPVTPTHRAASAPPVRPIPDWFRAAGAHQ